MTKKATPYVWLPEELHFEAEKMLADAQTMYPHKSGRGDKREQILREFIDRRLPQSIGATKGHIADSDGRITPEFDIILFNPLARLVISNADEGRKVLPVESVYAVIEVRTELDRRSVVDAVQKMQSLEKLLRYYRPTMLAHELDISDSQIQRPYPALKPSHVLPVIGYLFGYDGASYQTLTNELSKHPTILEAIVNLKGFICFNGYLTENEEEEKHLSPAIALSMFLLSIVGHLSNAAAMGAFTVPDLQRYFDPPPHWEA